MDLSSGRIQAQRLCPEFITFSNNVSPIIGYESVPLVNLEKAVKDLEPIIPNIQDMVYRVKYNSESPSQNLTVDESASIMLYTFPWPDEQKSLYYLLNEALRKGNRADLKSWFLYLKLFIGALSKLPSESEVVYRGVRKAIPADILPGKTFFWWSFSSCTTSLDVLQSDLFLGKTGTRTVFNIKCQTGKYILNHSKVKAEKECLLLPGCEFKVTGVLDAGNDLHIVQLEEISSPYTVSGFSNKGNVSASLKKEQYSLLSHNPTLKASIENCQSTILDLSGQQLSSADVSIVNSLGLINKQCTVLRLTSSGITPHIMSLLSDAIRNNQILQELDISHNGISDSGVRYLASSINGTSLKRLDLTGNGISDDGASYFISALQTNMKLTELSLSLNQIGRGTINKIAEILRSGGTILEVLNLSGNTGINAACVGELTEIIETKRSLKKLDLRSCDLSAVDEKGLQTLAKSKKPFRLWLTHFI